MSPYIIITANRNQSRNVSRNFFQTVDPRFIIMPIPERREEKLLFLSREKTVGKTIQTNEPMVSKKIKIERKKFFRVQ